MGLSKLYEHGTGAIIFPDTVVIINHIKDLNLDYLYSVQ